MDASEWDAWRDEDNHWIVQLQWQAGRTTNTAHWRFLPDAHGGSVSPLDDAASELVDPDFGRQLRGLAPVVAPDPDAPSQQTLDDYYGVDSDTESSEPVAETEPETPAEPPAQPKQAPGHANTKDKRGKPAMPSWEDVLLGVRSNGH